MLPRRTESPGKPDIIRAEWETFRRMVMRPDSGAVRTRDMRRAFYAGAWALFGVASAIGKDDVSEDDGVAILERVKDECIAFAEAVKRGDA